MRKNLCFQALKKFFEKMKKTLAFWKKAWYIIHVLANKLI